MHDSFRRMEVSENFTHLNFEQMFYKSLNVIRITDFTVQICLFRPRKSVRFLYTFENR